jgi:hypothetical protein
MGLASSETDNLRRLMAAACEGRDIVPASLQRLISAQD